MESINSQVEVRQLAKEDLWLIRELAIQIFPVTYQEIVEPIQIDYMMDLFYKPENLVNQFESGQVFLVIYFNRKAAGYASYTRLNETGDFKLNKIYVDTRDQGKGLGRTLINELIVRIKTAGGRNLELNVNKNNKAVGFYKAMGFRVKREELLDIGSGYFMDDYVMEITINPA
jgi:diamine N-acetyltransferase